MADAAFLGTLAFGVSAGLATFLAPCAYPLLPGYVGYYLGDDDATAVGAAVRGAAAAAGALLVLAALTGVVVTVGRSVASRLVYLEPVVGAALVALGAAYLLDRAPELRVGLPARRRSIAGFAAFGGAYAVAAAGCVAPVFLGVVAQSLALPGAQAAAVLGGYASAVALPLVGVTLAAAVGSDAFRGLARHVGSVRRLAGVVMVLAGLGQLALSASFLGFV